MTQKTKIVLASGSPRRKKILQSLGVMFDTIAPNTDETYDKSLTPKEIVKQISLQKAIAVSDKYPNSAVIAADTIVSLDFEILEKPKDINEAFKMLSKLSGRWHEVFTGICVLHQGNTSVFCEATKVHFKELDRDLLDWYIATGEPMDKAGSYGIQGYGAMLVDKIDGDFYNVMGFPISRIMDELKRLDIYDIRRG